MNTIQSVDRSIKILDLVAEKPARAPEIARILGVTPPGALKLLNSLRKAELLVKDSDDMYRLGAGCAKFLRSYVDGHYPLKPAQAHINDLALSLKTSVRLAILEDYYQVNIYAADFQTVLMGNDFPRRVPHAPWRQASGLCLLAFCTEKTLKRCLEHYPINSASDKKKLYQNLAEIKKCGYSKVAQSNSALGYLGVPLFNAFNQVTAAIGIHLIDLSQEKDALEALIETARNISLEKGFKI